MSGILDRFCNVIEAFVFALFVTAVIIGWILASVGWVAVLCLEVVLILPYFIIWLFSGKYYGFRLSNFYEDLFS